MSPAQQRKVALTYCENSKSHNVSLQNISVSCTNKIQSDQILHDLQASKEITKETKPFY